MKKSTANIHLEKKKSLPLIFVGIVLVIAVVAGGIGYYFGTMHKAQSGVETIQPGQNIQASSTPEAENVACTMDAKVCPDGSYVGRIGPNCEFEACP